MKIFIFVRKKMKKKDVSFLMDIKGGGGYFGLIED
jgi:hypothetical protein